ncbi:hypothetical protein G3I40_11145 [Streptomyces sp. SID14478]|uniref:tyrosinase cofactor n=1 Tax=Streptomyces sp. SID14478 TaxID=2706073 RepID=UPI0013D8FC6C|nr:tyrosinase cofactor [Streptomyces sp. SID14478]NEB75781.1 hypothetical protein [Streptomyces sp. SID14478]
MAVNPQVPFADPHPVAAAAAAASADPDPGTSPLLTRRSAALVLLGVTSTAAAFLAARPPTSPQADAPPEEFGETYRGRRIAGIRMPDATTGAGEWQVTVDGRPLHLMRRADGSYLTMVDHYDSCPTPLAAARRAVAELGEQTLQAHDRRL